MKKIKVLIVDDSAFVRKGLQKIISESDVTEITATAADPYFAVKKLQIEKPDVISLDIQMPRMDGLTFLKKIMLQHPIPVVVVSSLTKKESDIALDAYKYGATAVLEKPNMFNKETIEEWKNIYLDALQAACCSSLENVKKINISTPAKKVFKKFTPGNSNKLILIGSSAGGTEVIHQILSKLDLQTAPIAIVQHMPALFTKPYSERLNRGSALTVSEAKDGDILEFGKAFISPGDKHLLINRKGLKYCLKTSGAEKRNRYRPSVDVLFESAKNIDGKNIMAIILSGMGSDGSAAMMELKNAGALTVAQSKDSSIVYGMPYEAYKSGAATYSLSISNIVEMIKKFSSEL